MSDASCALPPEVTAPLDNIQVPDDCVSYTLRDNTPGTASRIPCRGCRRVTGDPHEYCILHLLGAGLPVCTRKARCRSCADTDNKFWLRYMKSHYGHCHNLKDAKFSEHLSIQQYYGILVDHRRRPDGSSVIMMRSSQHGGYMPEKAAPISVRSSSGDRVVAGCVSGSAEPSPVECAPPAIIRPIDSRGLVGAAIPPETLDERQTRSKNRNTLQVHSLRFLSCSRSRCITDFSASCNVLFFC